jgi:ATP-dependent helicase HrpA
MSRDNYESRPDYSKPEILRMGLDDVLLHMLAMRHTFQQLVDFGWMTSPDRRLWDDAFAHLELLGAIDKGGRLTDIGHLMADIPLPPAITKMILEARKGYCVKEVLTIAASFSTRPFFLRPPEQEREADEAHRRFKNRYSDFLTVLNVMRAWRKTPTADREAFCQQNFLHARALQDIESVTCQLTEILEEKRIPITSNGNSIEISKAVAAGLIRNLLRKSSGDGYGGQNPKGRVYMSKYLDGVFLFPGSSLAATDNYPSLVVCAEIVQTNGTYARLCQEVRSEWLLEWGLRDREVRGKKREKNYSRCGGAPRQPRVPERGRKHWRDRR